MGLKSCLATVLASFSRDNLHHQVSIGSPYFAAKFGTSDLISVGPCIPLRSCHLQSHLTRYITQLKWPRSTPSAVHRSVFEKTTVSPHILIEYGAISGRVASFAWTRSTSICHQLFVTPSLMSYVTTRNPKRNAKPRNRGHLCSLSAN
jgi:hypothetical protein